MEMEIISCCGIMCGECPVYIATERGDEQMKKFLAHKFSSSGRELAAEDIYCTGCHSPDREGDRFREGCSVRSCCRDKQVRLCAECRDFPCSLADRDIPAGTEHRARLEEMHEACKDLLHSSAD